MLSTIPNSFGDPHYCNIENENFCQQKTARKAGGGRRGDDQGLRLRRKTLRCARVRTGGAVTPRRPAFSVLRQQKNRPKGRTAERGEMIRACACGAKLFAALEYEQPGAYAPPVRLFSSPPTKKPPERRLFCWWR